MIEAGTTNKNEANHFTVDWDGPDDSNNPRKSDFPTVHDPRLKYSPCSWSFRKKWVVTALASAYTFLSPVASAMIAPAAPDIAAEFHITSSVETVLTVSIFVLAYGTSQSFSIVSTPGSSMAFWHIQHSDPSFLLPYQKYTGGHVFCRSQTLYSSVGGNGRDGARNKVSLSFSAFNLGCGFAQNKAQLTVLRFMAGLGGGAPLAVRTRFPNP